MGSADDRRHSRNRRPVQELAEPRRNGKAPLQSPVRIRWYRTQVRAKEQGRRLNSWAPAVALARANGGRQTIANEVPHGRPGRDAVEAAVRQALSGLDGRWRRAWILVTEEP